MHRARTLLDLVASFFNIVKACFVGHIARAAAQANNAPVCVPQLLRRHMAPPLSRTYAFSEGAAITGAPTVDGTGKFLIPGLIESHVHPQTCDDLSVLSGYGVTTAMNIACLN